MMRAAVTVAFFAALLAMLSGGHTARAAAAVDEPIVLTQIPVRAAHENAEGCCGGILRCDYGDGGRIVRYDPDNTLHVLTEGFDSACGADVSFDARRILFAGKRKAADAWNIFEMSADGSDVRQITHDAGNCRSPAYQSTLYTIISTEPWYQIMFTSDFAGAFNEVGCRPALSLYSCRLDGSELRRLTCNLSDDADPFLAPDGRVLLASWQRMHLDRGAGGRVAIFGVNTDGADYAFYCGDQGRRVKHMPCQTTSGLVVFVEADRVPWDGAGQLAAVSTRRPLYSYRPITTDAGALYHSPAPLPDGTLLVSRRPADGSATHGVYRLDPLTGEAQPVYDDPQWHDTHARFLGARPEPDGRSSVVNERFPTGQFYCLDSYLTDPSLQSHMQRGMIRRLRVIEGVPLRADAGAAGAKHGAAPIVQKRLLGVVPVEEDGSFNIELPADVPVQFQTLDESGMALRSCGWIWVKHHEPRGCIGCHEDPELAPANRFVLALRRPSMCLTLPPNRRRTVDFRRDIMPILTHKCAQCHAGADGMLDLGGRRQGDFNRAYVSLLAVVPEKVSSGEPVVGRYVHPGQARTSPLIWRLFGRNTSRPWDAAYRPGEALPGCPPDGAEPLTADEKLALIEWVDLGAHWDGIPDEDEAIAGNRDEGEE